MDGGVDDLRVGFVLVGLEHGGGDGGGREKGDAVAAWIIWHRH